MLLLKLDNSKNVQLTASVSARLSFANIIVYIFDTVAFRNHTQDVLEVFGIGKELFSQQRHIHTTRQQQTHD